MTAGEQVRRSSRKRGIVMDSKREREREKEREGEGI